MNKIHKLKIKKLKLNLNCHIETSKNHNLLQVYMKYDYTYLNHTSLVSQKEWSPRA